MMASVLGEKKIFLLDDGSAENKFLQSSLQAHGYQVLSSSDATFNPADLRSAPPDLMLVNIRDSIAEVQQTLYWMRSFCEAPIVGMVTAATLLDAGDAHFQIDQIIFKPFDLQQLQALIYVLSRARRRAGDGSAQQAQTEHKPDRRSDARLGPGNGTQSAKFRIDMDARDVYLDDQPLGLSPKEYSLFELLASRPGGLVCEDEIMKTLWPRNHGISDAEIRQYIYRLRRKIERNAVSSDCIQTVKGRGYRLGAGADAEQAQGMAAAPGAERV